VRARDGPHILTPYISQGHIFRDKNSSILPSVAFYPWIQCSESMQGLEVVFVRIQLISFYNDIEPYYNKYILNIHANF